MELLKGCPHCGGGARLRKNYSRKLQMYFVYVKCDICGAQGKSVTSKYEAEDDWNTPACEKAVSAWNMRVSEDYEDGLEDLFKIGRDLQ